MILFSTLVALINFNSLELLQNLLDRIQNLHSIDILAFIGAYILATVLLIPGAILTLGAGAIFGVVWGSIYVFIGATIGATAAFLIGRYFARQWVSKRIETNLKFSAIDEAVAQEGLKIVLLTRLSPIFPFTLLNYTFGITQVSLKDYLLGHLGMLPGTILYVYIGSLAGNLARLGSASQISQTAETAQWVLRIVGLVATVAVTVSVTQIARKALNQRGLSTTDSITPHDR